MTYAYKEAQYRILGRTDLCPASPGFNMNDVKTDEYTVVPGSGWCQTAYGGEGTARRFSVTNTKQEAMDACSIDNKCVAFSWDHVSRQTVFYTTTGCTSDCSHTAWQSNRNLITKAGWCCGQTHWRYAQCHVKVSGGISLVQKEQTNPTSSPEAVVPEGEHSWGPRPGDGGGTRVAAAKASSSSRRLFGGHSDTRRRRSARRRECVAPTAREHSGSSVHFSTKDFGTCMPQPLRLTHSMHRVRGCCPTEYILCW